MAITGLTKPYEALEFARNNPVHLAFLDIEIGKTSGLDVCEKLLAINPRTNVVFLTAYMDRAYDAWDTGACGFLLKPLSEETVRKQLSKLRYPFRTGGEQERWNRRFFLIFFALLVAYISSDLTSQISLVLLGPSYGTLSQLSVFFESLFSSMLLPLLTLYMLHCTDEDWKNSPTLYVSGCLWLVYLALLIITQFTMFIYYVTEDNLYRRGPWYPVLLIPTALLLLLNLIATLRRRARLSKKQQIALLSYLLLPLACMLIQTFSYGLLLIVIGTSVSAMFMFVFILSDQTDTYVRTCEELALKRAQVSVLQMRPHFIHNTLTSIYCLCGQDLEKAQQVILDFNSYLRKNFAAIAKEGTIPFTEIRERLKLICKGTLVITDREGGGTVVTISVPPINS